MSVVTSSKPRRPISTRHEQGQSYLALLLNWWLNKSGLSHEKVTRLADWGSGEIGLVSQSSVSHLRNNNHVRGASMKGLEGIAAANYAIWLWQQKGPEAAAEELGSCSSFKLEARDLDGAIWMPAAADDQMPLDVMALLQLSIGLLQLPYLQHTTLSPQENNRLSEQLSNLLNDLAGSGTPAEGIRRVMNAYSIKDENRRRRLRDLLLGDVFSREELEHELYALAQCVNSLRCLPEGSYGPMDLYAELSQERKRN